MKKSKRSLSALLVLMLIFTMTFGLAACGESSGGQETPGSAETEEPAETNEEGTLEISVDPGLTDISEADWGVCLRGDSVQYDLGLDVSRDWAMKPSLDKLDLTDENASIYFDGAVYDGDYRTICIRPVKGVGSIFESDD